MRPVTIVAPPNYPYHATASLQTRLKRFNANSAVAIVYGLPAGFTQTVDWAENELLDKDVLNQPFPNPSPQAVQTRAIARLRKRLEDIYGTARRDLVAMIGDYCSFCELPLAGHLLAVEHVVPKGLYPTYTTWWWNFLLACRDCNSQKGETPPRATATAWAAPVVNPTEIQLRAAIVAHYIWADSTIYTYRTIGRAYYYKVDTANPRQLTAPEAGFDQNVLSSFTLTEVRGKVLRGAFLRANRQVECRIFNNGGGVRGTATVGLTGIDTPGTARAALRTRIWLLICEEVSNLVTTVAALPRANRPAVFANMWKTLLALAVRSGFYSVWVDVLTQNAFPSRVPNTGPGGVPVFANLGEKFVFETNPANGGGPLRVFPGTDVTAVP